MGYTHYYTVHDWSSELWQAIWPQLIRDTCLIIEAADVPISGPIVVDKPQTDEIEPPLVCVDDGIHLNGVWDDSHEPFILSVDNHRREWCKTLRKPYDQVVGCILLRACTLAPQCIKIRSDGHWTEPDWKRAQGLFGKLWPGELLRCPWEEGERPKANVACGPTYMLPKVAIQADGAAGLSVSQLSQTQVNTALTTVLDADLGGMQKWLAWCEGDMGHCACKALPFQPKDLPGVSFRLIDLQRRCIVTPPRDTAFIALTYVWGGVEQLRLNRTTEPVLMQDGGLAVSWLRLSTTIRDAIIVCEKLGERHLWTDTLCIMQDSSRDMTVQLTWMRQIYASAKCAIAAVGAATADHGLLVSSRAEQVVPNSEDALTTLIASSPWEGRAWCYQEKVFSHRMIIFTHCGIYAQCQGGSYDVEGAQLERRNIRLLDTYNTCGGMLFVPRGEDLESFISAVEYYSQRQLTKSQDKKHAFEGIFRRYANGMDGQ